MAAFELPIVQTLLAERIAAQAADPKAAKAPEYVRLDFCEPCWQAQAPMPWISIWQGAYVAPEPPSPEPLPRETAESLLHRLLEDENSAEHVRVIFILAVMLERKKMLIERRVRRESDGSVVRVYEHKKTGEVMLITDPDLQAEEIVGVQQEVDRLLAPPVDAPSPESASPDPVDARTAGVERGAESAGR